VDHNLEMAGLVVRSCQRAATLISSFKRVAVDQTSEHQRHFDLAELVEDNLRALRPSLTVGACVIDNRVAHGISCDSYPGPLGQVLTNLIQNAIAHAFEAGKTGTVVINGQCVGDVVELRVSDDGKGMSQEILARIFEPFFTTALGKGGSGLGLAVCHNMVTGVLGGSIRAQSSVGQGSDFFVRFPLAVPARAGATRL
jgi:signal transduction histidine kinase